MFLDLFYQLGLIQLSPGLRGQVGTVVQILKEMLIRMCTGEES